ncbi:hypothetical protein CHS0354_033313 [Potamilus streckersoni]|uniref:Uncharacterized protein n=1 Tax=Potamilus streckersoni TaxID=2493646 RepID=A0AAE0VIV4_9BIVA|nr:hypothetical protein CHS0354_033313 [Potamilus streckersoni]
MRVIYKYKILVDTAATQITITFTHILRPNHGHIVIEQYTSINYTTVTILRKGKLFSSQ